MAGNKGTWRSISGNRFAKAMWFARLRSSGAFDPDCKEKKGKCKGKTKGSSKVLKAGRFANTGPRNGPKAVSDMRKATAENVKKGLFKKGGGGTGARIALTRNIRQQQQEAVKSGREKVRGAKFSSSLKSANVTPEGGKTRQVKVKTAVGVNAKRASEANRQSAQAMRKKERTGKVKSTQQRQLSAKFGAMERGERVTTPKRKNSKR